jgi:hypothetical protein
MCSKIEALLKITLKNYGAPMVTNDHPEIDETDLLEPEHIKIYQMLIGCAQWVIPIGRFNIQYSTNTLARFSTCPRGIGHLKIIVHVFGYLKHHMKHRIEFNNDPPDYSGLNFLDHDWSTNYHGAQEDIPDDAPPFQD